MLDSVDYLRDRRQTQCQGGARADPGWGRTLKHTVHLSMRFGARSAVARRPTTHPAVVPRSTGEQPTQERHPWLREHRQTRPCPGGSVVSMADATTRGRATAGGAECGLSGHDQTSPQHLFKKASLTGLRDLRSSIYVFVRLFVWPTRQR
jgi:hypothetical protein